MLLFLDKPIENYINVYCANGTYSALYNIFGNGIYTKDDKSTYYIFENANPYIFDDCFEYLRSSRVYCEDKFVDYLTEYRLIFEDDAFFDTDDKTLSNAIHNVYVAEGIYD